LFFVQNPHFKNASWYNGAIVSFRSAERIGLYRPNVDELVPGVWLQQQQITATIT